MLDTLREVICNYVDVSPEEITEESGLTDDLALSSYDVICILGEIEEKLDVTVNEADIVDIRTVGEVIAYLEGLKK